MLSFYDSFSLWDNSSIANVYFVSPRPEPVHVVMTSATEQSTSINNIGAVMSSASCTGNPSLQSWNAVSNNETLMRAVREELYGDTPDIDVDEIIGVVFAGGYGSGYDNSIKIFCDTVLQLKNGGANPYMKFVFCPHPGYSSSYEARKFADWGCLPHVKIIPEDDTAPGHLSTSQAISASNVSISYCSTVGGQSLAVGTLLMYVIYVRTSLNNCLQAFPMCMLILCTKVHQDVRMCLQRRT